MDIIVQGSASNFFKPDQVILNFNFRTKTADYESALSKGTANVESFFKSVIEKLKFNREDIKTTTFKVSQETRYDTEKKRHINDGYSYSQTATLKFDYNADLMAKFIEETSKISNPPFYTISFGIKNEEKAKSLVIADAYRKAEEKAKMIALAAGKKLKDCIKIDFKPFDERVISGSNLDTIAHYEKRASINGVSDIIKNVFTPEDVVVSETLYCLWIAE